MSVISLEQAIEKIQNANNIYSVVFSKRSNGLDRVMCCRNKVSVGVNGNGLNFNPLEKGLLPTYDMNARGHRMINLRGLKKIRVNGKEHAVRH